MASAMLAGALAGCDKLPFGSSSPFDLTCSIPTSQLMDGGVGVDGIPAITNPDFVPLDAPEASFIPGTRRVIGIEADGEYLAIPHNILWWHEIVNMDLPSGRQIAVTYCPLTASALVFDRAVINGSELGVSGLLRNNNLVMYDRSSGRSLWQQMEARARCGPADGTRLTVLPHIEMTWDGWRALYPDSRVIGNNTGHGADYTRYPYGSYESLSATQLLFPQQNLDRRRFTKERIFGVPSRTGPGGVAFPFLEFLDAAGSAEALHWTLEGEEFVVFWDGAKLAASAWIPEADGTPLTFEARGDEIVDLETESVWRIDGLAVDGPLQGVRLEQVARGYVAFWFAWTDFQPETDVWERGG